MQSEKFESSIRRFPAEAQLIRSMSPVKSTPVNSLNNTTETPALNATKHDAPN